MFKVAGVTKYKGAVKVRFANDMTRVKVLDKNGHTEINLLELPKEMDKSEIVKFLKTTDLYDNHDFKIAIDEAIEKYNGTATVKAAKSAVVKTGGKPAVAKHETKKTAAKKAAPSSTMSIEDLKARAKSVAPGTKVKTQ